MTKRASFVMGTPLPDKLPKKAIAFFANAVTPRRAFEIAEQVARIAAKNNPGAKVKRAS